MKKLIYLLIPFIFLANTFAFGSTEDEKTKIDLDKEIGNKENEKERSLELPYVTAYLIAGQNEVEVELFSVGEAYIAILNSFGQVVASDIVLTNIPTLTTLEVPAGKGMYYIIIDSSEIYAQGWFVM